MSFTNKKRGHYDLLYCVAFLLAGSCNIISSICVNFIPLKGSINLIQFSLPMV